jgi:hypothetical protein
VDADAVVAAMRAHPHDEETQGWAFEALIDMTRGNAGSQIRAGNAGAVEAVVAAMHALAHHGGMVHDACLALGAMTDGNAQNRTRAGASGAVEAVVAGRGLHSFPF